MKLEVSVSLSYKCPKCNHKFKVTLQKLLYGSVICPKCESKNGRAISRTISDEPTRAWNGKDKALMILQAFLSKN